VVTTVAPHWACTITYNVEEIASYINWTFQ